MIYFLKSLLIFLFLSSSSISLPTEIDRAGQWARCSGFFLENSKILKINMPKKGIDYRVVSSLTEKMRTDANLAAAEALVILRKNGFTNTQQAVKILHPWSVEGRTLAELYAMNDPLIILRSGSAAHNEMMKCFNLNANVQDAAIALSMTDGDGNKYLVKETSNGVLLNSKEVSISLTEKCIALSSSFGKGRWGWANGGVIIEFSHKRIGFPHQDSPFNDGICRL